MLSSKSFLFSLFLHLILIFILGILFKSPVKNIQNKSLEIDLSKIDFLERASENNKKAQKFDFEIYKLKKSPSKLKKNSEGMKDDKSPAKVNFPKKFSSFENYGNKKLLIEKEGFTKKENIKESSLDFKESFEKIEKVENKDSSFEVYALSQENTWEEDTQKQNFEGGFLKPKEGIKTQGSPTSLSNSANENKKVALLRKKADAEAKFLSQKLSIISNIMRSHLTYPYLARRMGWQGDLILSFVLTPFGELKDIKIEKSTGYEILDRQAKETLLKVAKYFPKPEVEVRVKLPVSFRLESP